MNITAPLKVTKQQFYEFVQQQAEGRFEWERGRIVQQMTGGTFDHTQIAQRIRDCLMHQLEPAQWSISLHERGVETVETIRYPDVVVEPAGADGKSLATCEPVLVAEVLSKSSQTRDLATKPAEYTSLESLHAYIVASQDGPECWVWLRGADGRFPETAAKVEGRDALIHVASLGVELPLGVIYRGIGA
jgi:Uma2 family endonuclease